MIDTIAGFSNKLTFIAIKSIVILAKRSNVYKAINFWRISA